MSAKEAFSIIGGVLIMVVSGARDQKAGQCGYDAFKAHLERAGTRRILMDTRLATNADQPQWLMDRARTFGAATPPCRVAILARALDGEFARIYRRALADTGHDAQVFTSSSEAEAWLSSEFEGERLYLA
ncbi:hypothetical protein ACWCOP_09895 [Maricaulaceae bacterium MS644]